MKKFGSCAVHIFKFDVIMKEKEGTCVKISGQINLLVLGDVASANEGHLDD